MRYAFYPKWYIAKEDQLRGKRLKRLLVLFLLFILLLIMELSIEIKTIKTIEENLKKRIDTYSLQSNLYVKEEKNENGIEPAFKEVVEFLRYRNLSVWAISVNENRIYITFEIREKREYGKIISLIEERFKLIQVTTPTERGERLYFDVEMESNE